jgi:hypothetical protein
MKNITLIDRLLEAPRGTCVSVIVPLFTPSNMRKQNLNVLDKAVLKTKKLLEAYREQEEIKETISARLDELSSQFNNDGSSLGLGLFVSETVSGIIEFPFPVDEFTLVADSFETRDVEYLKKYRAPYHVLLVGKSGVRLFAGSTNSLEEIRNSHFPALYSDEYQYEKTSLGTSFGHAMKGFEKDKNIRLASMIRESVKYLPGVIGNSKNELIILGPAKLSREVAGLLPPPLKATSILEHSYNAKDFIPVARTVWKEIQRIRKHTNDELINHLNDLGINYRVEGLRRVWEAAGKGQGRLLLVERDFRRGAYLPDGSEQIRLHPPRGKYRRIADAVDDVIEKVKSKHGEVVFVEHDQLSQHEGIALILRYQ